ncbi:MAG: MFS transporter [Candidatus Methanomethylophilus sp.]|nr:MFS transporter [Methanomethylophilus sp.]
MQKRELVNLSCLVAGVFIFNMSEFTPTGLMTSICSDLDVSESDIGLIISVYAWLVAILAIPLMTLLKDLEYRRLLLIAVFLFAMFHVMTGLSDSYTLLFASRMGVAVSHAIFWSSVVAIAVKVVSEEHRSIAIGSVSVGTAVALILGMPIGRAIGLAVGWRMTFIVLALLAFVLMALLLTIFPKVDNPGTFTISRFPEIFANRILLGVYLLLFVFMMGFYEFYSYLEPFLKQVAGISDSAVSLAMILFGVAGIAAGGCFARFYDRYRYYYTITPCILAFISLYLIGFLCEYEIAMFVLSFIIGFSMTSFTSALQSVNIGNSPEDGSTMATAMFSAVFNIGIAVGTMIGGYVIDDVGIGMIGNAGGSILLLAALVAIAAVIPAALKRDRKPAP